MADEPSFVNRFQQELFEAKTKLTLWAKTLTKEDVPEAIFRTVVDVEKNTRSYLAGEDKRDLVVRVVTAVIHEAGDDEMATFFTEEAVGKLVDILVLALNTTMKAGCCCL